MFDKKAWIREYIESKTVRDHMEHAKLSFSDTEMATITFNSGKPLRTIQQTLETSLDKGTQRKTTENELPSLTQCTA